MFDVVTEQAFELDKTKEYKLSIQISLDGFSFSIVCPNQNKLLAYKKTLRSLSHAEILPRRFAEWIQSEEILKNTFAETILYIESENFTLIPLEYFDSSRNLPVTETLFETDNKHAVKSNKIGSSELELIYTVQNDIIAFVKKYFSNVKYKHIVSKIIDNLPSIDAKNGIVVLPNENNIFVVVFNKKKVIMANSYKVSHDNDTLYYLLSIANQFEFNSKNTPVFLANNFANAETITTLFNDYFSTVKNIEVNNKLIFDTEKSPKISDLTFGII